MKTQLEKLVEIDGRSLQISNLDKPIWPDDGLTKSDLIDYYYRMAETMLPYIRDRPLSLHRSPQGITGEFFYQKNAPEYRPKWLPVYPYRFESKAGGTTNLILPQDRATLVWIANQVSIEIHPWLSRVDAIDRPDWVVFDLDPFPPATFDDTRNIALLVRTALGQFGLRGYPKTSGATGIHIYLPLIRKYNYRETRAFAEFIGRAIGNAYPEKISWEWTVAKRGGRIRIDYTQNVLGKTIAAAYSLRPFPGAPASTPVTWQEIEDGITPSDFSMRTLFDRLDKIGDIFKPALEDRQSIDEALILAGIEPPKRAAAPEEGSPLSAYEQKRRFDETPEPLAEEGGGQNDRFVVQEHHASHLHWDFRLEMNGVLRSWAVPKGPPVNPGDRRLAVQVEDHPVDYIGFEGVIPEGSYGAGEVTIWDQGKYSLIKDKTNEIIVRLFGTRLSGQYVLIRTGGKNWLMMKRKGE